MKILMLDIETAPNLAYVWGLFKENIPVVRLVEAGYTLCYTAKWYGSEKIFHGSLHLDGHKKMVKDIHRLLDEADAVVHYNGQKFDIPVLNKEFVLLGFPPPAPYKQIDLYLTVREKFRFPSNKLEYVVGPKALNVGVKHSPTFDTWEKCMQGDKTAWKEMERYNIDDVLLLEKVYVRILPWIKGHANHSLYQDQVACPNCGGTHFQRRGTHISGAAKYHRFQCQATGCGHWFRVGKSIAQKPVNKGVSI